MDCIVDLVVISRAVSRLSVRIASIDVRAVGIPVGSKARLIRCLTEGLLDFARQVTVLWNKLQGERAYL